VNKFLTIVIAVASLTLVGCLAPPANVTAVAGDKQVTLSWDSVDNASYNVYYAKERIVDIQHYAALDGGTLLSNLTVITKTITGLSNNTLYYFVVTATSNPPNSSESRASNEVSATPKALVLAAWTGILNDTGITWGGDFPSGNNANCIGDNIAGQDCAHGWDAKALAGTLSKVGAGSAGFDFTKLDVDGKPLPASAQSWSCVQDNHTRLIWEVKTTALDLHHKNDQYSWYNTDANTNGGSSGDANDGGDGSICYGYNALDSSTYCNTEAFVNRVNNKTLCGASDWRMPNLSELRSILDYSHKGLSIDSAYFPNTPILFWSSLFWSSVPYYLSDLNSAWGVNFYSGVNYDYNHYSRVGVRLVRNAQ